MTQRFVPIKTVTMGDTAIIDGKPVGSPTYWMQQDSSMTLAEGIDSIAVADPATSQANTPTFIWLADDLTAPTDADGYNLSTWPEHNGGPSWYSTGAYRPNVRKRRFRSTKKGQYVTWDKSVYFEHNSVNHMWIDLGSGVGSQPYTVIIVGLIHSYPSATYGHYLLDAGKPTPTLNVKKDHTIKDKLAYRSAMLFQQSSGLMGTHTKSDLTYGKHVRVKHNYRRFPRMFFGVFNGTKSRLGAFDKRFKFFKSGKVDNKTARYLVMGRRTNKVSDNLSAHMTVVEVQYFNRALSKAELKAQYRHIAGKYKFNKIAVL